MTHRQPSLFIPHGSGPCFFMPDPKGVWAKMAGFLRSLPSHLPERPLAILLVSGHWETSGITITCGGSPALIYDYNGFPAHTYALSYPAPGAPKLAVEIADRLRATGIAAQADPLRGWDHGVFVPMKVAFPAADIPIVEVSLDRSLDPALHLSAGAALAPLRDAGVVIIGSGMSFHNLRHFGDAAVSAPAAAFDEWLGVTVALPADQRAARLADWAGAPGARLAHPREEHLLPLMVAAGASDRPGFRIHHEVLLRAAQSAFRFD